eukprot:SM000109S14161  [mRNA]  locus=s109:287082:290839:+ [translate_table: standard]
MAAGAVLLARRPLLVACPHDAAHRLPPAAIYAHAEACRQKREHGVHGAWLPTEDWESSAFFYERAPSAVTVRNGATLELLARRDAELRDLEARRLQGEDRRSQESAGPGGVVALSAARLWQADREIAGWQAVPPAYSPTVAAVVVALPRLAISHVEAAVLALAAAWLPPSAAACFATLVRVALGRVAMEAAAAMPGSGGDRPIPCPVLAKQARWLASHAAALCSLATAGATTLALLQHLLLRTIALLGDSTEADELELCTPTIELPVGEATAEQGSGGIDVAKALTSFYELALAARHRKEGLPDTAAAEWIRSYDQVVEAAEVERRLRPATTSTASSIAEAAYQANLAAEKEKRDKSTVERLAEERDYKRRRISYRAKHGLRTATTMMREIIEKQMLAMSEFLETNKNMESGARSRRSPESEERHLLDNDRARRERDPAGMPAVDEEDNPKGKEALHRPGRLGTDANHKAQRIQRESEDRRARERSGHSRQSYEGRELDRVPDSWRATEVDRERADRFDGETSDRVAWDREEGNNARQERSRSHRARQSELEGSAEVEENDERRRGRGRERESRGHSRHDRAHSHDAKARVERRAASRQRHEGERSELRNDGRQLQGRTRRSPEELDRWQGGQ